MSAGSDVLIAPAVVLDGTDGAAPVRLDGMHESWHAACRQALAGDCHEAVRVDKGAVPDPARSGFVRHRGLWYGQEADWRFTLSDGRGIHVRQYPDRYDVHWDRVCPLRKPVRHMVFDTPWLCASTVVALLAFTTGVGVMRRSYRR